MPKHMPQHMPKHMPQHMPKHVPKRVSKRMSEHMARHHAYRAISRHHAYRAISSSTLRRAPPTDGTSPPTCADATPADVDRYLWILVGIDRYLWTPADVDGYLWIFIFQAVRAPLSVGLGVPVGQCPRGNHTAGGHRYPQIFVDSCRHS